MTPSSLASNAMHLYPQFTLLCAKWTRHASALLYGVVCYDWKPHASFAEHETVFIRAYMTKQGVCWSTNMFPLMHWLQSQDIPFHKDPFDNFNSSNFASFITGLFSIAFTMAICGGKRPEEVIFDAKRMRQHLLQCLENTCRVITHFLAKKRNFQRKIKGRETQWGSTVDVDYRKENPWSYVTYAWNGTITHTLLYLHVYNEVWATSYYKWQCCNCNWVLYNIMYASVPFCFLYFLLIIMLLLCSCANEIKVSPIRVHFFDCLILYAMYVILIS